MKLIAALLALGVTLAACNEPTPVIENANLRVAHLSPNTPNVDIWLDGKVVDALKNVYATGTTSNPAINVTGVILEKKNYTVGAIGLLNGTAAQALTAKIFVDDLTVNATKARVRVIHASPDAPAVDVGVKGDAPAAAVVKNIKFPDATAAYLELAPAVYPLEIRPTGTATVALGFNTPALEANKVYTVFAVNTLAKLEVIAVADAAQ
jgi:hypothetical protein